MNLILEKTDQVRYFTNMLLIFKALGLSAADYDWYVSDIETNCPDSMFSQDDRWISGRELQEFLEKNDVQFIWAVFSAVPKGFRFVVETPPYIYDNPSYWSGHEVLPQLDGALFEIVCWDSSATILVGLPVEAEASFVRAFSDTRPLVSVAQLNG
ncbi:hypothetical protein ACH50O_01480 [Methylomonas sp. 2BW1-5-20]|uniref:hypothetical protein n=1 Tax=Methylomonas sp. 2BW1-5-20 TaxID=3376686 RepID=UPI0040525150